MSNDGWGNGWPITGKTIAEAQEQGRTVEAKVLSDMIAKAGEIIIEQFLPTAEDLASGMSFKRVTYVDDKIVVKSISHEEAFKTIERNNLHPTHDPYTNPDSHIYYECKCGQILDPGTKSFAELNNQASKVGWKVRWGDKSYVPYCVECGKGVE